MIKFYLECFGIRGAVIILGFLKHYDSHYSSNFCKFYNLSIIEVGPVFG